MSNAEKIRKTKKVKTNFFREPCSKKGKKKNQRKRLLRDENESSLVVAKKFAQRRVRGI